MMLNFLLFGNGHGLKSPFFDDKFYWLVDVKRKSRASKNGRFYKWIGGFGAQLESIEWRKPDIGQRRVLFGHEFKVFNCSSAGISLLGFKIPLKYMVAWSHCQSNQITREELNH